MEPLWRCHYGDADYKKYFWIVPPLWQSEFRNVLAGYIRRGMILQQAQQIMTEALLTLKNHQVLPSPDKILALISECDCTAYDCEFIALAQQLGLQLVTADKQLLDQFPDIAISLEEFTQ
jgi:predicted nucleic acid-binding protein